MASRLGHDFGAVRVHANMPGGGRTAEPANGTSTISTGEERETETQTSSPCRNVSGTHALPSGTLAATLSGGKLGASWTMAADFTSDPPNPAVCGPCGEYRQFVRGTFMKNGSVVVHPLCGTNLDPNNFQEDCGVFGGTQYKYGYHSIPFANSKFSKPDQPTGQRWEGSDSPGIRGASGDKLSIDLEFTGNLVDTCNGQSLAVGSSWKVQGTATLP